MGRGEQLGARVGAGGISMSSLWACIGFGFLGAWIWLGLLMGFPLFRDASIDNFSVACLLVGFAACAFATGFSNALRAWVLRWMRVVFVSSAALVVCVVAYVVDLGILAFPDVVGIWVVRSCSLLIGIATAILLQCYAFFFCRYRLAESFFGYCLSFVGTFLAFFLVDSLDSPLSEVAFAVLPLLSALLLKPGFPSVVERGVSSSGKAGVWPRTFSRMVIAFVAYSFAASLSQSFEPPQDFALSVDMGMVLFAIVLAMACFVVLSYGRKLGIMSILKVFYQAVMVLLVFKLVLQSLASEDSYFAAINNMTWLLMFAAFWLLMVVACRTEGASEARVFALVFGSVSVAMLAAWFIGEYFYELFSWRRTYISVAAGCIVTIFCTFGFSTKDFPRLFHSEGVQKGVQVTMEEALESLAEECGLSPREKEILMLVAQGTDAQRVADCLTISYHTVRTHMRNLYAKLKVTSRSELMLLVVQRKDELSGEKLELARKKVE